MYNTEHQWSILNELTTSGRDKNGPLSLVTSINPLNLHLHPNLMWILNLVIGDEISSLNLLEINGVLHDKFVVI